MLTLPSSQGILSLCAEKTLKMNQGDLQRGLRFGSEGWGSW